jgi:hypothetical protein
MSESEERLYQELEKGVGDLEKAIGRYPRDACERTALESTKR